MGGNPKEGYKGKYRIEFLGRFERGRLGIY